MLEKTMPNLRIATPEDASSIASVHVAAWRATYRGILEDEVLDGLRIESRTKQWVENLSRPDHHVLVVEKSNEGIVGFADCGPERSGDLGFAGELYAVYLLQECRGQGIGTMLFRRAADVLLKAGISDMMVWVLEANPYRGFYEAMGGRKYYTERAKIGGGTFEKIAYGWKDIHDLVTD